MQIWRTTRLVPGTCYMNARLVSLWWVGLAMLPQKTLASFSICSFLFRCAHEFLWFWTRRQLIEISHISPLRKNSGSTQFVERRKGVHDRQGDLSLFAKFQYKRSKKKKAVQITSLFGVWWYLNTIFIANALPKLKLVGRAKQEGTANQDFSGWALSKQKIKACD